MPHKHTRKGEDKASIDLPPTIIAQPLSVSKSANANGIFTTPLDNAPHHPRANKKRKRKDAHDDTPKAFARLMAFQRGEKLPKGLDDGLTLSKAERKRRRAPRAPSLAEPNDHDHTTEQTGGGARLLTTPTIRVGEKMSEFSARVDAALPLSGLLNKTAKNGKDPLGLKVGRTKTERRMQRMYAEWRVQDVKIKEKREEALELAEEEEEGSDGQVRWKGEVGEERRAGKKGKKGGKKRKVRGEVDDGDDDPWAVVKRNRAETKGGLHDVVLAPPSFSTIPKEKFKVREGRGVNDVPNASGSLKRRAELGEVRRGVVDAYGALMKAGKGGDAEEGS